MATRTRSQFGSLLRDALTSQGVSIRELARRLNPERPETARRSLIRYIKGEVIPEQRNRDEIAAALGLSTDYFAENAEEALQRERLARALEPLLDALMLAVHETVEKEMASKTKLRVVA